MKSYLLHNSIFYRWISTDWLIKRSQVPLVLLYHVVNDDQPTYLKHVQHIKKVDEFRRDLDYLKKHFRFISLREIVESFKQVKPAVHLTFDDGLRECYDIIVPILIEEKIPATFFVNPGFVENMNMSHRYKASYLISGLLKATSEQLGQIYKLLAIAPDLQQAISKIKQSTYKDLPLLERLAEILKADFNILLQDEKPYMSPDQIRELKSMGFSIGSHGYEHKEFHLMDFQEQKNDILDCIEWMNVHIKPEKHFFAFPFTDDQVHARLYADLAKEIDMTFFGTAGLKNDSLLNSFQRIPVEYPGRSIETVVKMEYFYYILKKPIGKNKVLR